jgi:ribosomal-protein-alanine N-acetyltransferase
VSAAAAPRKVAGIETERLRLRRLVEGDLERWHRVVFADADVMRFLPSGVPVSLERTRDVFRRFEEGWARRGLAPWGVELLASGELIGHCGLRHVDELPGEVEVLYALARDHWGQGYATEAASASVRFGFEHVGLDRILAFAQPLNVASRHVMEKLGMTYERTARLFGIDAVVYRLVRGDFVPPRSPYRLT